MEVRLTRFVRFENEGALQAFCDVAVGDLVLIKGLRVIEGRTGPFISMPRQVSSNSGKWFDSVVFLSADVKAAVTRVVLEAYAASERVRLASAQNEGAPCHANSPAT